MLERTTKWIEISRHLSLDVVTGGVIYANALAHIYQLRLPISVSMALGSCIWLIYTLDHLIDARSVLKEASTKRHKFHQKNSKPIFLFFLLIAVIGLCTLFYLPYQILIYGCVLLGLVGLYFLTIWFFKIFFSKEFFIALLYTCGVFIGVFSLAGQIPISLVLLFFQSLIIAFINLLLFSWIEIEQDRMDGHKSWATQFGEEKSKMHIKYLFVLMLIFLLVGAWVCQEDLKLLLMESVLFSMNMVLWFVYMKKEKLITGERYRWLGDFVFFIPGLVFLL